jgi:hypothetical protein
MTTRLADRKPVKTFILVANEYIAFINRRNELSELEVYQRAFRLLPKLLLAAMDLPEINRWKDALIDYDLWSKLWNEVHPDLYAKFRKRNNEYSVLNDPYKDIPGIAKDKTFEMPCVAILSDISPISTAICLEDLNNGANIKNKMTFCVACFGT